MRVRDAIRTNSVGYHPEERSTFWQMLKSDTTPTPMPTLQYPTLFAMPRLHTATSPPANHPDPPHLPSQGGTASVPHSNLSTTFRRPVDYTALSARLLPRRRNLECGHSTSTRPQHAAGATASYPCARRRRCRHVTAMPGANPESASMLRYVAIWLLRSARLAD
jgi:hypothetical protein